MYNLTTLVLKIFNDEPFVLENGNETVRYCYKTRKIMIRLWASSIEDTHVQEFGLMIQQGVESILQSISSISPSTHLYDIFLLKWVRLQSSIASIQYIFLKFRHATHLDINKLILSRYRTTIVIPLGHQLVESLALLHDDQVERVLSSILSMLHVLNGLSHGDREHTQMEVLLVEVSLVLKKYSDLFPEESMSLAAVVLTSQSANVK